MSDDDMSTSSERKIEANRANSQKSTGPKTTEGKLRSRRNALKHGLCAVVIDVDGEDPDALDARLGLWDPELNPLGTNAVRYVVEQAVRKSLRLDRCHVVHDSTVAQLVRDAPRARRDARMSQVEAMKRLLPTDPDIARRKLRETSEGCEFLLEEWAAHDICLGTPLAWDLADERHAAVLMGNLMSVLAQAPSPMRPSTLAIEEHRAVARRLELNARPQVPWEVKYNGDRSHQYDRDRLPALELAAAEGKAMIVAYIGLEVADLEATRLSLLAIEAAEESESGLRARFDDTDRGKLFHRYEGETERGLHRDLKEAREMTRWTIQMNDLIRLAEKPPARDVSPPGPPVRRNEATGAGGSRPTTGPRVVECDGYSVVDVAITPDYDPKRRQ